MSTETVVLSKGDKFFKEHGYSRTMQKNINKSGVFGVDEYRKLRKDRKKKAKLAASAKKDRIKAAKKVKTSNQIKKK